VLGIVYQRDEPILVKVAGIVEIGCQRKGCVPLYLRWKRKV